jgi:hypothetical protein
MADECRCYDRNQSRSLISLNFCALKLKATELRSEKMIRKPVLAVDLAFAFYAIGEGQEFQLVSINAEIWSKRQDRRELTCAACRCRFCRLPSLQTNRTRGK